MSTHSARLALPHPFALLALLPLAALAGCGPMLANVESTATKVFKTDNAPTIVLQTYNGSVDISAGEEDEVVVEFTKRAGGLDRDAANENLDLIDIKMEQRENTLHIVARPRMHLQQSGVSFVIAVPKGATLKLNSSNAPIVCEGLVGGIDATTSNAKIVTVDARGQIDARTSNAGIEIEGQLDHVDARTSNAKISFVGTLGKGEQRFSTSNAKIDLQLPTESEFRFDGSTSNGRIETDFPIEGGRKRKRTLSGEVGNNPKTSIVAATSNASIHLGKVRPKRQPHEDD